MKININKAEDELEDVFQIHLKLKKRKVLKFKNVKKLNGKRKW